MSADSTVSFVAFLGKYYACKVRSNDFSPSQSSNSSQIDSRFMFLGYQQAIDGRTGAHGKSLPNFSYAHIQIAEFGTRSRYTDQKRNLRSQIYLARSQEYRYSLG